jgi:ribosomal protein S18 acetylase RimI-like enzyme
MVDIEIVCDCSKTDWKLIPEILKSVGLSYEKPEIHQKAFNASHAVVFVYRDSRLIGFGRAISDGAYQAAIYDIAVIPEFQKMGIGRTMMEKIMERISGCNVILYAAPGKEDFYRKLGWRKMKTGMAFFKNPERMKERGFTD